MAGRHHRGHGHELGQTSGDGEGQGGLACYSPWDRKELDMSYRLNGSNIISICCHVSIFLITIKVIKNFKQTTVSIALNNIALKNIFQILYSYAMNLLICSTFSGQISNAVFLTIVTTLQVTSQEITQLLTGSLYTFAHFPHTYTPSLPTTNLFSVSMSLLDSTRH